ncbi:MAG: diguanylate cyclase [Halopseudomonas sp.]
MQERFFFYSDFNCPFCFALNERILMLGDSAKVLWRGIEHMPAASSKHSTLVDQTQLINEVGVVRKRAPEVSIVTPSYRPKTLLPNALILTLSHQTDSARKLSELRTLIYRAYWQEGADISDPEILQGLCLQVELDYPEGDFAAQAEAELEQWQQQWEGEQFHCRLPAMMSEQQGKPLLGFPTFDLLSGFFSGSEMPLVPESLAACELKPKQSLLLVGAGIEQRCDVTELRAAYQIELADDVEGAKKWFKEQTCLPDMVVIDFVTQGDSGLRYCSTLRSDPDHRNTALILLLSSPDQELELSCFDAGATDVMFDLSNPKICQARLDLQLRMKRSAVLLASLARLDYLTELPNRREFDRKIEEEWLRARRKGSELGVVLIDIDHFKLYNDNYGHSMGDDCLRQVARAMAKGLRRPADLLARYGGEEFVAVLPETGLEGSRVVAETMIQAVRDVCLPHAHSSAADCVTISAGVSSMVPTNDATPRSLSELADAALYKAKESGRNRVCLSGS